MIVYNKLQYKPKVEYAFNHFGPIEIRVATVYPIGTSFGPTQHWSYIVVLNFSVNTNLELSW